MTGYYESIDWEGLVSRMFELLGAAIGGATALIASLASNIWDGIKQAWEDVKTYFGEYFDEYGGNIIAGLLAGILNAILDIGTWIYDNIFKPFIDGFKAAFGIASPSTVMKEQGGFIIDGLLGGLTEGWKAILDWVEGIVADFAGFSAVYGRTSKARLPRHGRVSRIPSPAFGMDFPKVRLKHGRASKLLFPTHGIT